MFTDNSPQLEVNHHPRCTCARHLALHTTLLSALRARTLTIFSALIYMCLMSILLVKQARHAVRVDTWLCEHINYK